MIIVLEGVTTDFIQVGIKATGWEDAIMKSSQILLDKGCITTNYVNAMIKSVKDNGPYIVLCKNIALAHTRPELGVNRFGISFTKLDTPINFGVKEFDPIKIIITLAAEDSDSHIELLCDIADILSDEERVSKLVNCNNEEELLDIILNK